MIYHVACRIVLCSKLHKIYKDYARHYFERFVLLTPLLYGYESLVLNLHNLVHIVDDSERHGCSLSDIMAFNFESFLGFLKKMVKSGFKPLEQVCNKVLQDMLFETEKPKIPSPVEILKSSQQTDGTLMIKKLRFKNFILTSKPPNNVISLQNGEIMQIDVIKKLPGSTNIIIDGLILKKIAPAFLYPTNSSIFNTFKIDENQNLPSGSIKISEIDAKMIKLSIFEIENDDKETFVVPLLHCDGNLS